MPEGWREIGFKGQKKNCLEHIATVWTDMRPLSLQKRSLFSETLPSCFEGRLFPAAGTLRQQGLSFAGQPSSKYQAHAGSMLATAARQPAPTG